MRLFLFLSLIALNSYAFCMEQNNNNACTQSLLSFDDIPHDVRKIILNEYQRMGVKIQPHWDKKNEQLVIMTFAPDEKKETQIIYDTETLNPISKMITGKIQNGTLLTQKQLDHIKDVHCTIWNKKQVESPGELNEEEIRNELNSFSMEKTYATVDSYQRLEKTRGLYLIKFNLYFSNQENEQSSFITSENTKQLAIHDRSLKKITYIGCPDPSWKNFTIDHSVSVQPNFATKVFAKTVQEIAKENKN